MNNKLKKSKYNHFVDLGTKRHLAFNAITCGMAEVENSKLNNFLSLSETDDICKKITDREFLEDLQKGGFLINDDTNEIDSIRAGHYHSRFGNDAIGLTILPTYQCNFACDYCYEDSDLHSMKKDEGASMSDEVCDNIVKFCENEIKESSTLSVTWYGGEPLLRKNIIENLTNRFKQICEEKKSKYYAGIITNGYLLNASTVKFLCDTSISFAQITIDGPESIHNSRRTLRSGGNTYRKIIENIQAINDDTPFNISIRINIDHRNASAINTLLDELKKLGFDQKKNVSIYFGQVIQYSNSCPDISGHCMHTADFSEFMLSAYKYAMDLGFKIGNYPIRPIGTCGAVSNNSFVVEPNGNIQNCWNTIGDDVLKTGVLTDKGIEWTKNRAKWLGWSTFTDNCQDCSVLPICMGDCPYKSIYKDKVFDSDSNSCKWWKYNLPSMLKLDNIAIKKGLLHIPGRTEPLNVAKAQTINEKT